MKFKLTNIKADKFTKIDIFFLSIVQYIEYMILVIYLWITFPIYILAHILKLITELIIFLLEKGEDLISGAGMFLGTLESMRKGRGVLMKNILKIMKR